MTVYTTALLDAANEFENPDDVSDEPVFRIVLLSLYECSDANQAIDIVNLSIKALDAMFDDKKETDMDSARRIAIVRGVFAASIPTLWQIESDEMTARIKSSR